MKKGFFFVVVIFLILGYILVSVSMWTASLQETEKRFSDRFRTSNIDLVMSQITEEKLRNLTELILYDSLARLNDFSVQNPVRVGESDEFQYIRKAFFELVSNGTANPENFETDNELSIGEDKSLSGWSKRFNSSISKTGLQLTDFSVSSFNIDDNYLGNLSYSIVIHVAIEEKSGTASVKRDYELNGDINIEGLTDPAIARKALSSDVDIQKQFFFEPHYTSPNQVSPIDLTDQEAFQISEGQGWFYGPLITVSAVKNIPDFEKDKHILVGTYEDIINLRSSEVENPLSYQDFGAYIVTTTPVPLPTEPPFTSKPYLVINNFALYTTEPGAVETENVLTIPECPEGQCLLFITPYDYDDIEINPSIRILPVGAGRIYDIEDLRDFALCSYYTNNPLSPSYLQRLLSDSFTRRSELGIDTFLIGKYIGGAGIESGVSLPQPPPYRDVLSREDRELFNDIEGEKIRGMPGCKDKEMCSSDSLVGHFRLGYEAMTSFITQEISCINGMAPCE